MRILKATMPTVLVAMLVLASAPMTTADQGTIKTEWLSYTGTNFGLEDLATDPVQLEEPCDQDGVGGVRFCQALDPANMPSDVAIEVRDALGLPVAFYFQFLDATGAILHEGFACRQINTPVPSNDSSPNLKPDSNALVVRPALGQSIFGEEPTLTIPSVPLGAADTINNATPDEVPDLPDETPEVSQPHPLPCLSPTGVNGQVVTNWRY